MSIKYALNAADGGTAVINVHSWGSLTLYRALAFLTPDERAHLAVHAYGPAALISAEEWGLADAWNYINKSDFVPWVGDFFNMAKEQINPGKYNIVWHDEGGWFDHPFMKYQWAWGKVGEQFQKDHGG